MRHSQRHLLCLTLASLPSGHQFVRDDGACCTCQRPQKEARQTSDSGIGTHPPPPHHLLSALRLWGKKRGREIAPTEACKACQCILSKSGQRREPSIMEKTQSPSPGHLDERAGRTSPGSRGSRPIRPPLAERQPGLFCERLQSPVRVSQLTMERLCRFRFHFHQRGKRSTMGQCPRLGNRTRFSLGFPGLGTWKRPEPRQTREAGQILRYAFLVAIKHISSYHLMGSLCLWGKGRCC